MSKTSLSTFVNFAKSVGFDIVNCHPVERLAFQTVAVIKLNPHKEFSLNHNELTLYDSIIFTLFIVRMVCITQISNRDNAEEFSELYIQKVFQYFPESKKISEKYDIDYFAERVMYYDSLVEYDSLSFEECTAKIVSAFESIIKYDYIGKYVRFNQDTPLVLNDFFDDFKISTDVQIFYKNIPEFFKDILPDVFETYNNNAISKQFLKERRDEIIDTFPIERNFRPTSTTSTLNPQNIEKVKMEVRREQQKKIEREIEKQREHQENMSCLLQVLQVLSPFIFIGLIILILSIVSLFN